MPKYITTKEQLKKCLEIELKQCECGLLKYCPLIISERQLKFQIIYNLRKWEYHKNSNHVLRAKFYRVTTGYWESRTGVLIPPNVVDVGLSIGHVGPIIINPYCEIGRRCRIHVGVNIGAGAINKPGKCPKIGDDVYIGPGAKIFGNVTIASGCKIGANAVVNRTFPNANKTIVGVPAGEK